MNTSFEDIIRSLNNLLNLYPELSKDKLYLVLEEKIENFENELKDRLKHKDLPCEVCWRKSVQSCRVCIKEIFD